MNVVAFFISGGGNTRTRYGKYKSHGINTIAPTNLEDLFASEVTCPRVAVLEPSIFSHTNTQMQAHTTSHAYMQIQN